jgi:hypothetical protein
LNWQEQSDMAVLRAQARRKYQALIDFVKENVGPGQEYANDLVRVVISDNGCYYEFLDLPEEFSGAVGTAFAAEFVPSETGVDLLARIHELVCASDDANTNELSVLALYDKEGLYWPESIYIHHFCRAEESGPATAGWYRPDTLPLFFKVKVDSRIARPLIGIDRGIIFFVANLTDQHLLVRIPHVGSDLADLNLAMQPQTVH